MTPIIAVKDVSFGYTKDNILEHVNMTVEEGEYVGIIGANGAGKSTLLKLILGELTPRTGEISMMGKPMTEFKDFSSIGYVPQVGFSKVSNFPANVTEIIVANLYGKIGPVRFPKKEHYKKVEEVLKLVNMEPYKKRLISDLSGGQQQRVMIARALVNDPKLLLLDEPITGIDAESEAQLYSILEKLNKEKGIAIVMISHNVEQIAKYTHRFYHIKHRGIHEDHSAVICDDEWKDKRIIKKPSNYYATKKSRQERGK